MNNPKVLKTIHFHPDVIEAVDDLRKTAKLSYAQFVGTDPRVLHWLGQHGRPIPEYAPQGRPPGGGIRQPVAVPPPAAPLSPPPVASPPRPLPWRKEEEDVVPSPSALRATMKDLFGELDAPAAGNPREPAEDEAEGEELVDWELHGPDGIIRRIPLPPDFSTRSRRDGPRMTALLHELFGDRMGYTDDGESGTIALFATGNAGNANFALIPP